MAPFFSVILPVYNVAPWLGAALRSVRAQTETSWECLCVDDGSVDASAEVLLTAVRQEPRFKVIFQPNKGVSAARNRALAQASGEYVCFIDGDDVAYRWWLQTYAETIARTGADLVRSAFPAYRAYAPGKKRGCAHEQVYETPEEVLRWGWKTFCAKGYAWTYAVRRACLKGCRFPEGIRLKEDVIFALCLLPNCRKAVQLGAISYWYRRRMDSAARRVSAAEEPIRRIRCYETLWREQGRGMREPDVVHALSHLIWHDLAECLLGGGRKPLPEMVVRACDAGLLELHTLPPLWRVLLGFCRRGVVWPMGVYVQGRQWLWRWGQRFHTLWRNGVERMRRERCYSYGEETR